MDWKADQNSKALLWIFGASTSALQQKRFLCHAPCFSDCILAVREREMHEQQRECAHTVRIENHQQLIREFCKVHAYVGYHRWLQ